MANIEILHCAETIKGGIATYLRELLPLQAETFGAEAIAVIIPESQRTELPSLKGVKILTYKDKKNRALNSISIAKVTAHFIRENPTKIVHIHSTFAGVTLRPLIWILYRKVKAIYCPHGWAWDRPMSRWKRTLTIWIEKALSHLCKRIICISQHEKNTAIKIGINESKLSVVLNGMGCAPCPSTKQYAAWPGSGRKLLFIGRFDNQKGVDIFCDSLRQLKNKASGIIVGDYVLGDSEQLELPSNARHIGWLTAEDLQSLYLTADILIVPSRWEGFGLVAVEAMRAGLPVIASNVGGLAEVVEDNATGILIDPNSVQALVDAINRLSLESLKEMGMLGKLRFSQCFTIQRVHHELLGIYHNL
ncbi:glycosyltransferase [Pseudomonas fragi]|uniref:glycosyltransferase n=1 Tax=Pseudomonas fragi TaxID=296 RepID=UPI00381BB8E9